MVVRPFIVTLILVCTAQLHGSVHSDDSDAVTLPPIVRFIRIYGSSNELSPPVLLVNQRSRTLNPVFGEQRLTVEIDIQVPVPPAFSVSFVHCRADWTEDENLFLSDAGFMRTTNISWMNAPPSSRYYTYRGTISVPNESVKIPYGGNWKAKVTELGNDTTVYAEARFFALDCAAECTLDVFSDFYEPVKRVSPSALMLEASITANTLISDLQLHTAVFYRLNRWNEAMVATQSSSLNFGTRNRLIGPSGIGGMSGAGKRFRIERIPAENDYRVLDMSNLAQFPRSDYPIRIPFTDLRRNGSMFYPGDNAAMITSTFSSYNDEYVPVEFILDPENRLPSDDVFVVGSFNNWKPGREWQMQYIESERLYKLRHWLRRARHNYAYATGRCNADTQEVDNLSYEEFEGNNVSAGHVFVAFIYSRELNYGGYDNIVAVSAASVYGPLRK